MYNIYIYILKILVLAPKLVGEKKREGTVGVISSFLIINVQEMGTADVCHQSQCPDLCHKHKD